MRVGRIRIGTLLTMVSPTHRTSMYMCTNAERLTCSGCTSSDGRRVNKPVPPVPNRASTFCPRGCQQLNVIARLELAQSGYTGCALGQGSLQLKGKFGGWLGAGSCSATSQHDRGSSTPRPDGWSERVQLCAAHPAVCHLGSGSRGALYEERSVGR